MGNGLHHALVQRKRRFHQGFSISRGATPDQLGRLRHHSFQLSQSELGSQNRVSLVSGIERVEQLAILADHHHLGGGGTGIDAQIAVSRISRKFLLAHNRLVMPVTEGLVFLLAAEQRLQPGHFEGSLYTGFQGGNQAVDGNSLLIPGLHCRTHGGEQMGILRVHRSFIRQL